MSKKRVLALAFTLILIGLMLVSQAKAEIDIPKPSGPEFAVQLVDYSYDTPPTTPTYTIDPFTGEQKQLTSGSPSHHIENKSIEITVENQPFAPYTDSNGNHIGYYYDIRFKGHYGTDWTYDPFKPDGTSTYSYGGYDMTSVEPYKASTSEHTIITYFLGKSGIPNYGEVDLAVQAQIGYIQQNGNEFERRVYGVTYSFIGVSSDWSSTQTVTIGNVTPSPKSSNSPTTEPTSKPSIIPTTEPSPTPNHQSGFLGTNLPVEYGYAIVAVLVIVVVAGLSLVYLKKVRKN